MSESVPSLPTLAVEMEICLRSLEHAFRACVGMSPARYLRRMRLNRVHGLLTQRGPGETTVTDLAMNEGFSELGRFAGEYR
jgi:AraC family ethanolamine operon transcriptional activator